MNRFRFSLLGLMSVVWGAAVLLALARGSTNAAALMVLWTSWVAVTWVAFEIVVLRRLPSGKITVAGRDRVVIVLAFVLTTMAVLGATVWILRS